MGTEIGKSDSKRGDELLPAQAHSVFHDNTCNQFKYVTLLTNHQRLRADSSSDDFDRKNNHSLPNVGGPHADIRP